MSNIIKAAKDNIKNLTLKSSNWGTLDTIKKARRQYVVLSLPAIAIAGFLVALIFGRTLMGAEQGAIGANLRDSLYPQHPSITVPGPMGVNIPALTPGGSLETSNLNISVTTDSPQGYTMTLSMGNALGSCLRHGTAPSSAQCSSLNQRFRLNSIATDNATTLAPNTWGVSLNSGTNWRIVPEAAPIYLQEITLATCPTERTMAVDARDNRTYWIRRISNTASGGGDLCWMETNLAYGGGGTTTHGDTMDLTVRNAGAGAWNNSTPFVRTDNREPLFTTQPTPPSLQTGNHAQAQYGFFYNWCAAMGGSTANPLACNTTTSSQTMLQTANLGAGHNANTTVCPKGWRLPKTHPQGTIGGTNNTNTNEFWNLNQTQNGTTGNDAGLLTNWLGVRAGNLDESTGIIANVGTWGGYWSSTVITSTGTNALNFSTTNASPSGYCLKAQGCSVRCVLDSASTNVASPDHSNELLLRNTATPITNEITTLTFGARAGNDVVSGIYTATLRAAITANSVNSATISAISTNNPGGPLIARLAGGDTLTINGTNFTGAWQVVINTPTPTIINSNDCNIVSDTQITCTLPELPVGERTVTVRTWGSPNGVTSAQSIVSAVAVPAILDIALLIESFAQAQITNITIEPETGS